MKKLVFLVLLSCLTHCLFAQFTFSPIVAANLSKSKVNQKGFETSPVLRFVLGVQPVYHFSDKTAIGLGLQLATKGYKDGNGYYSLGGENRYSYIELNPLFEYKPFKWLGIIGGGTVGYSIMTEIKYGGKWIEPSMYYPDEKWDAAATLGLRFYYGNAFMNLQFAQSVLPFYRAYQTDDQGVSIESLKQYHQNLSLGVGYNFHLKKK